MHKDAKIFIAGHKGMVGSALCRALKAQGFDNLIVREKNQLDLTNQGDVEAFFNQNKPEYVFLAAARVGGIKANIHYRAEFIYQNLMIQNNIIHQAYLHQVQRLLFLGSSCIYPRNAPQPMREEHLLTGALEQTNEPYAIAKIAGLKMCEAYNHQFGTSFISAMPTNLYGPGDNFDLENSHVLPAILRKLVEAKQNNNDRINVWGTGRALREFMYVDDMADACVFLMTQPNLDHEVFNVGSGDECTIAELVELIKATVGYTGSIKFDPSMPDGTPRKWLDRTRMNELGWKAPTRLETGVRKTYEWLVQNQGYRN